jgi:hypothetical protein
VPNTDLETRSSSLADRLVELQERVKRQERQAMFVQPNRAGRRTCDDVLAPDQNIGNSSGADVTMWMPNQPRCSTRPSTRVDDARLMDDSATSSN